MDPPPGHFYFEILASTGKMRHRSPQPSNPPDMSGTVLWVELCSPQTSYVEILTPKPQNMILFVNRVVGDVIG